MKSKYLVSLLKTYHISNSSLRLINIVLNIVGVILLLSLLSVINWISIFFAFILASLLYLINFILKRYRKNVYETLYIRDQLLMMLYTNGLFTETHDNKGNKIIERSAVLSFSITSDIIIVTGYVTGDEFSKKIRELDIYLSGAIGLELEKKNDGPDYVDYYFPKNKKEIQQFLFSDLNKSFFEDIPLDEVPLTNNQRFSLKKNTNLGIYGRTGAGKTVALQWLLYNSVAKGCGIAPNTYLSIVDGKGADLFSLGELLRDELGNNVSVGQTPTSLAKLSREFVEVMNARFEVIKNSDSLNADAYDLHMLPSFLFVDELASIKDSCGSNKQGKELWNEILQNLGLIARKGRQAACHLCISTQDPNSENVPVELRNQITCILYLGNPSPDRIKMAFAMCELENVPTVSGRKGEALFYADGKNMIEPELTVIPFINITTKADFINIIKKIRPL